jgi:RNA polymerase sigma factor (sigma-70 family)
MEDDELFAALYPALRRFAAVIRPVGVDPDDLVQEAVARTLARSTLSELDDAGTYLRTVIARLASNQRRDHRRRRAIVDRWVRPSDSQEDHHPSDVVEALRGLAPDVRAVLYLRIVEGLSHEEIAQVLDVSVEAARTRYSRAIRDLRVRESAADQEVPG